jgi:hypothetical protein
MMEMKKHHEFEHAVNLKKGETPFAENVLARLRIVCAIMAPRL